MNIFKNLRTKPIENRILEIKKILADEGRKRDIARGIRLEIYEKKLEKENQPLLAELDQLQAKRSFIQDNRVISSGILAIIVSLVIAFAVPWYQAQQEKNDSVEYLYRTVVANGDIFSANYNELKIAGNQNSPAPFLESFISFPMQDIDQKPFQKKLGINQYRFLRYYLSLSDSLNKEIESYREDILAQQPASLAKSVRAASLMSRLESLQSGDWKDSKFNYIYDTACLQHLLSRTFSFIHVAERDKGVKCEPDSLNRLFYHYGFIPAEIPKWLMLELINALNKREGGMGDRLIRPYLEDGVYLK